MVPVDNTGVVHLQAKQLQGSLTTAKAGKTAGSPSVPPEGTNPTDTFISDFEPQGQIQYISVV